VKKYLVLALLSALALAVAGGALAFSQGNGATAAANWKVYKFNSSGQAYNSRVATTTANGIGFTFLPTPDDALFITTNKNSGLLGNLTGKTLSATFTVSGGPFTLLRRGNAGQPVRFARVGSPLLHWRHDREVRLYEVLVVEPDARPTSQRPPSR
jgi:hypothetical protein